MPESDPPSPEGLRRTGPPSPKGLRRTGPPSPKGLRRDKSVLPKGDAVSVPPSQAFVTLISVVLALASLSASPVGAAHPVPQSGAYELHPDFELSLFAAEPDVVDPVALTFDERDECLLSKCAI